MISFDLADFSPNVAIVTKKLPILGLYFVDFTIASARIFVQHNQDVVVYSNLSPVEGATKEAGKLPYKRPKPKARSMRQPFPFLVHAHPASSLSFIFGLLQAIQGG